MSDEELFEDDGMDALMAAVVDDMEPSPDMLRVLRDSFGHTRFKGDGQWKIIDGIIREKVDQCVVMATGYGKSLCYQTALVISPLIALMEDQVSAMRVVNIPACLLGSAQANKSDVYDQISDGSVRIVYATPEFVDSSLDMLSNVLPASKLCLVAIDEAHCVSQWGHDFRKSYRNLSKLREKYSKTPFLALTATATDQVIEDMCTSLKLQRPQVTKGTFNRPNLYIEVSSKKGIWKDLSSLMSGSSFGTGKHFPGPTIIYCPTRKDVENVAEILDSHGIKVCKYHAGLTPSMRTNNQRAFVRDQVEAIVCTIAFGMGINKPDVRQVIHYGAPRDMESYYQEIGRAGRDGQKALAKVFFSSGDFQTHRFFLNDISDDARRSHRESVLHKMEVFLGMAKSCRRKSVLSHFGESLDNSKIGGNECCDNCSSSILNASPNKTEDEAVDFSSDARLLLEAVLDCNGYFGLGVPVSVLKGSVSKNRDHLTKTQSFGKGKHRSKAYWMSLGRSLVTEKLIGQKVCKSSNPSMSFNSYTTVYLSDLGQEFLHQVDQVIKLIPTKEMRQERVEGVRSKDVISLAPFKDPGRMDLFKQLLDLRSTIAAEENLAPYMIFTEDSLLQLSAVRPSTPTAMKKMTIVQAKIDKFGLRFCSLISSWSSKHNLPIDCFSESNVLTLSDCNLTETQQTSYQLFCELSSPAEVADKRGLKEGTIMSHLSEAVKQGLPVDKAKTGLSEEIEAAVARAIASDAVSSDVLRLAPIKGQYDAKEGTEIEWGILRLAVSFLMLRFGVQENKLQWSDEERRKALHSTSDLQPSGEGTIADEEETKDEKLSRLEGEARGSLKRMLSSTSRQSPQAREDIKKKMKKNSLFR